MIKLTKTEQEYYLRDLFKLLHIPSVSTLRENKSDVLKAVEWLESYTEKLGFSTKRLYGSGLSEETNNPVLFCKRSNDISNPTILIYGHYDVQPAEPLDSWASPPFEPEIRDGNIYARGATDDKGQMFTHLAALDRLAQTWGDKWPVNVKLLLEGEEEMGGENIEVILKEKASTELLKADYCFVSDTGFVAPNMPTIEYGLRGIAYMQINVKLSERDLHSGLFGGAVLNPANVLGSILGRLEDPRTGMVTIPGIYDDVEVLSASERKRLSEIPYSEKQFLKEAGNSKAARPEEGYSVVESTAVRPSVDINGVWSGFTGEGAKTIIPATAHAKVSIRTVPNQEPARVAELFTKYVESLAPKEVDVEVETIHVGDGALIDVEGKGVKLAAASLEKTFGQPVVYSRSGGSIPVVSLIQKSLRIDPVLIGYGLPDDGLHSPNEKLSVDQFNKGIECNIDLYQKIAES